MQRPAICCEQMRCSVEPRSSHLLLPARALGLRQSTAADPGIPRTDDRGAAHRDLDRGACVRRARLASYSRGNIEIIAVDGPAEDLVRVRRGAPDATRPATECNE